MSAAEDAAAAGEAIWRAARGEDASGALARLDPALGARISRALQREASVEHHFHAALELAPAERGAYLERACAGNEGLRRRVRELIESAEALPRGFLAGGDGDPERIGDYVIEGRLGRGGQGSVYLAFDTRLERRVALKVLTSALPPSREMLRRFHREAAAAARLEHPGICTVYESGEVDGRRYIAMRYVEGTTLQELLERSRAQRDSMLRLPASAAPGAMRRRGMESVVALVEQLAAALAAAHEAGVLHRDVKPGNVIVAADGAPVLVDFGLARDLQVPDSLTRSGDCFGTPHYMAPEQLARQGAPPDQRADVYALGVVLYECATLRLPCVGETLEALVQAVLAREPRSPRRIQRAVSADLAVVIATALAKDRNWRYATAGSLAEDLRAILERRPIRARPIDPFRRALRWIRRQPARFAASFLVTAGLAALGALAGDVIAGRSDALLGRALELDATVRGHVDLGLGWVASPSPSRAREHFHRALELDPGADLALAGLWLVEPDPERGLALVEARGGAREGPASTPDYTCLRGLALVEVGRGAEAEALLGEPSAALSALPHLAKAFALEPEFAMGNSDKAEEALWELDLAIGKSARLYVLHALRLRAASMTRDGHQVGEAARVLTDVWSERPEAWLEAARALSASDPAEARRALETGIEQTGDAPALGRLRAELALMDGRLDEASELFRAELARDPGASDALVRLASTELVLGRCASAASLLGEAEARHGQDPALLEMQAVARQRSGDLPGALEALERAIAAGPGLDRLRARRAALLVCADRLAEAEAELGRALAIHRGRPWTWTLRARLALARGRTEEAAELQREARALTGGDPSGRSAILGSWDRAGARELLELDRDLHPRAAQAWHALARFLVDPAMQQVPWDAPAALHAAQRAAELAGPEDAAVLATLAEAHFANGERREALAAAASALAVANDAGLRDSLAEALERYGR